MPADKPTELSRIKLKTWTRQPVPMISEHSAHSTPQPFGIRTWLWRYTHKYIHTYIHTYLLLLISMLWHRQAIFKSKGDKLCSSAESRIWTRDPRHQIASKLHARWQTDWAIEDQAKKLELDSPSLWSYVRYVHTYVLLTIGSSCVPSIGKNDIFFHMGL